jgi:hypothetical protein
LNPAQAQLSRLSKFLKGDGTKDEFITVVYQYDPDPGNGVYESGGHAFVLLRSKGEYHYCGSWLDVKDYHNLPKFKPSDRIEGKKFLNDFETFLNLFRKESKELSLDEEAALSAKHGQGSWEKYYVKEHQYHNLFPTRKLYEAHKKLFGIGINERSLDKLTRGYTPRVHVGSPQEYDAAFLNELLTTQSI